MSGTFSGQPASHPQTALAEKGPRHAPDTLPGLTPSSVRISAAGSNSQRTVRRKLLSEKTVATRLQVRRVSGTFPDHPSPHPPLPGGVMVTQGILVPSFQVRVLAG